MCCHKSSPLFSSCHHSFTLLRRANVLLFGLVVKGKTPFTSTTINSPLCCKVTAVSAGKLSWWHWSTKGLKHTSCALHPWLPGRAHCTSLTSCFVWCLLSTTVCTYIVSKVKKRSSQSSDSLLIVFSRHVNGWILCCLPDMPFLLHALLSHVVCKILNMLKFTVAAFTLKLVN